MELKLISEEGGVARVSATGKIQQRKLSRDSDLLAQTVGEGTYRKKVILGFEDVDFIDSSGIGYLLVCHKRFREEGGRLVLHSLPPLVLSVIKISQVDRVLEIAENEAAALKIVTSPPPAEPAPPKPSYPEQRSDEAAAEDDADQTDDADSEQPT